MKMINEYGNAIRNADTPDKQKELARLGYVPYVPVAVAPAEQKPEEVKKPAPKPAAKKPATKKK